MNDPRPIETWTSEPGSVQRDPRTYLRIIWRWKWLFLVIAASIPIAVALLRPPPPPVKYRASTLLQVQSVTVDTSLFSTSEFTSPQSIQSASVLIRTTGVAQAAAKLLTPMPTDLRALLDQIATQPDPIAGFITIHATDRQADGAADIANAFANAVVQTRTDKAVAALNRTIGRVKQQLAELSKNDTTGRAQLSQQLQRLRALRAAQG
nr:hypothetical protein [Solirubrobacterales bacterium]